MRGKRAGPGVDGGVVATAPQAFKNTHRAHPHSTYSGNTLRPATNPNSAAIRETSYTAFRSCPTRS